MTRDTHAAGPEPGGGAVVPLTIADLADRPGGAVLPDLVLAERLGFADRHMIRRLIERNRAELETHGELLQEVSVAVTETSGGRPGRTFLLNEAQALVVTMLSRTPRAAEVRTAIIRVYQAWRAGQLPPAAGAPIGATVALPAELLARLVDALAGHAAALDRLTAAAGHAAALAADDALSGFLRQHVVPDAGGAIQARRLCEAWTRHCAGLGLDAGSEKRFALRMQARGLRATRTFVAGRDCNAYRGLGLLEFKSLSPIGGLRTNAPPSPRREPGGLH